MAFTTSGTTGRTSTTIPPSSTTLPPTIHHETFNSGSERTGPSLMSRESTVPIWSSTTPNPLTARPDVSDSFDQGFGPDRSGRDSGLGISPEPTRPDSPSAAELALTIGGLMVSLAQADRMIKEFYRMACYRSDPRLIGVGSRTDSMATRAWRVASEGVQSIWAPLWFTGQAIRDQAVRQAFEDQADHEVLTRWLSAQGTQSPDGSSQSFMTANSGVDNNTVDDAAGNTSGDADPEDTSGDGADNDEGYTILVYERCEKLRRDKF